MNKPYDVSSLSPVETLLLGRVAALESMLAGMGNTVAANLTSTKPAIEALVQHCGKAVENAEEQAAALYLHQLAARSAPAAGDLLEGNWSFEELLKLSEEPAKDLDAELNAYLPRSGISTALGDIGYPVCIGVDRFLEAWKDNIVELPKDESKVLETILKYMHKTSGLKLFRGNLVHPAQQDELLFILGNAVNTFLVIAPARLTWYVMSYPNALSPPFFHRQARVLDTAKAIGQMRSIFVTAQDPKVRALLREHDDATTKIQVLLSTIFQADKIVEADVNREGLFHFAGSSWHGSRRTCVIHRVIDDRTVGIQLRFFQEDGKHAYITIGDRMVPTVLDDLPPQSKAIIIEVLTAMAKKIKPAKKTAAKSTRKK